MLTVPVSASLFASQTQNVTLIALEKIIWHLWLHWSFFKFCLYYKTWRFYVLNHLQSVLLALKPREKKFNQIRDYIQLNSKIHDYLGFALNSQAHINPV